MANKAPTHTCFVTNLPYGVTEENLIEVFREVGPVKSTRIVTDRETGRQKGFAFVEYYDWQTAQSAIRNLDGHEINGRKVIVKFAEKDHDSTARPSRDGQNRGSKASMKPKAMGVEAARAASYSVAAVVGGPPPAPGGSGELISSALGTKSRAELYEIMAQMKSLVQQNPEQARQILVQNAQLTKALFQAEIMLGMVKGAPIVPSPAPAPSHPSPAPQQQPQQQPQPQPQPIAQHPLQPQQQHYAPQHPSPPVQQHPPQPQRYAPQPLPLPPPQQPQPGPSYHQPPPIQHGGPVPNGSYAPAYGGVPAPASVPQPMDPRAPPAAQMSAPMDPRTAQHSQPMEAWNGGQGPPQGQGFPLQQQQQQQQMDGQQYGVPQQQSQYHLQPQPQPDQPMPQADQMGMMPPSMDEDTQQALIQQVMQLTPEQVAALPPEQQQQVQALRDAVMSGQAPSV